MSELLEQAPSFGVNEGLSLVARSPDDVVIVGVGVVSPFGEGVERLWQGLLSGTTAIRGVSLDDALPGHWIAGHVPGARRGTGGDDPVFTFARTATAEALRGVGDLPDDLRVGVVYGSCNGALTTAEEVVGSIVAGGAPDLGRLQWLSPQAVAECVAEVVDATGPVVSVNTACASGAHAIIGAADQLRTGQADVVIAGGADALSRIALVGFRRLGALADEPATPYSAHRGGMSLGEGAASLVLTRRSRAEDLGWSVLGVLSGHGMSADGFHITSPDPSGAGAGRAIAAAVGSARVAAERIGYVNGHGTGTAKNDIAEDAAISVGLGDRGPVALSSSKSMTGHLLGAAGAIEAVIALWALREGMCPPSHGVREVDPALRADIVTRPRPAPIEFAMSNSFAFGGANACLVLGRETAAGAEHVILDHDVVITAAAVLTPFDRNRDELAARFESGRRVDWEHRQLEPEIAGFAPRALRRIDRAGRIAVAGTSEACIEAGLTASEDVGLFVGTGFGPSESLETFMSDVLRSPSSGGSPAVFPNTVYNAPAGHVTQLLGLRGPTSTLTSDCAAGLAALSAASDALRVGRARAILVNALEVSSPMAVGHSLATRGGSARESLHEVSACFALETAWGARERGATVLADVVAAEAGFGLSELRLEDTLRRLLSGVASDLRAEGITYWRTAMRGLDHLSRSDGIDSVNDFVERCGYFGAGTSFAALATAIAQRQPGLHLIADSTARGAHSMTLIAVRGDTIT